MGRHPAAAPLSDDALAFWLRHLAIGVWLTYATAAAGLLYALATWDQPNRGGIAAVAAAAMAWASVIALLPRRRLVTSRWRPPFFGAWSMVSCAAVSLVMHLDGGVASPFAVMLSLPLIFAAMAFRPSGVIALSGWALALFSLVALVDRDHATAPPLLAGAALLLAASMAALTARSHLTVSGAHPGRGRRGSGMAVRPSGGALAATDVAARGGTIAFLTARSSHSYG